MSVSVLDSKSAEVIDRIIDECEKVSRGDHELKPGMPHYMTGAESVGDTVCQGDFWIIVAEKVPESGFKKREEFKSGDAQVSNVGQLVPGNTVGSRHCLNTVSDEKVEVYYPEVWNEDSLVGPYLVVKSDGVVIEHPKHGHVHLHKDTVYRCVYQREYDKVQKAERRSRD